MDSPTQTGTPACDIEIPSGHPLNAAVDVKDEGLAFVYGRADSSVRDLYIIDNKGRHRQKIHEGNSGEGRWFFIPVQNHNLRDVIGTLPDGKEYSLAPELSLFLKERK